MKVDVKPQDMRDGDWVVAESEGHHFEGPAWLEDGQARVGGVVVYDLPLRANPSQRDWIKIVSVTREVPDLPREPGTVFEALVTRRGESKITRVFVSGSFFVPIYTSAKAVGGGYSTVPGGIDPSTVRILLPAKHGGDGGDEAETK